MKKYSVVAVSLLLVIVMLGCSAPVGGSLLMSRRPRAENPTVSQSDAEALADGNSRFALQLYQQLLKSNSGNMFYSPYSLSLALAMTYAGARGSTETEMANTLHFTLPQDRLHPAFDQLDLALNSRGKNARGQDDTTPFKLNIVNAIWGQQDFKFLSSYLDTLAENYGAGLRVLDFIKQPEPSRQTINQWVSDQTNGKIKDLLPPNSINDMTRLVLTNAIYFNAGWKIRFDKAATQPGTFTNLGGAAATAQMMKLLKTFKYGEGGNYQAVELLYDGDEIAMDIILPKSGSFEEFEQGLTAEHLSAILNGMTSRMVDLTMPKFSVSSEFALKSVLAAMGMPTAFSDSADFSGMDGARDLQIKDVVHKSYVSVDENGTEAAAASGVIVGIVSIPVAEATMRIDRSFIFVIRDLATGTILFIGRVVQL